MYCYFSPGIYLIYYFLISKLHTQLSFKKKKKKKLHTYTVIGLKAMPFLFKLHLQEEHVSFLLELISILLNSDHNRINLLAEVIFIQIGKTECHPHHIKEYFITRISHKVSISQIK